MVRSRPDLAMGGGSVSGGVGSFDVGRGRRICDLELSGPDDFAISLTDWEAHKALADWEEHKDPNGKSASRRSTRFNEEYLEVTLDIRDNADAVAIQSVVEMSEAALLLPTPGPSDLSSRLKAELRCISSMTKQPPVPARR